MKYEDEYSLQTNQGYGSSEVVNIGLMIDQAWKFCWPKVIARAWTYQHKYPANAEVIETGETLNLPTDADRWYADLLSQDPLRTKQALEAEGMVFLAAQNTDKEHWEHWMFTRMLVRAYNQKFELVVNMEPEGELKEQLRIKASLPQAQKNELNNRVKKLAKLRYLALTGYEKQVAKNDEQDLAKLDKLLGKIPEGLFYVLDPKSTPDFFKRYQSGAANGYSRSFPWDDIKATGHNAILTLPPKPINPLDFGRALADYKTSINIYPLS
ncbi:MAG: hypothetical protein MJK04_30535 [Psychrosphaera sp.]|nr:hypothetical protein [Psychrosphaera sp.]